MFAFFLYFFLSQPLGALGAVAVARFPHSPPSLSPLTDKHFLPRTTRHQKVWKHRLKLAGVKQGNMSYCFGLTAVFVTMARHHILSYFPWCTWGPGLLGQSVSRKKRPHLEDKKAADRLCYNLACLFPDTLLGNWCGPITNTTTFISWHLFPLSFPFQVVSGYSFHYLHLRGGYSGKNKNF